VCVYIYIYIYIYIVCVCARAFVYNGLLQYSVTCVFVSRMVSECYETNVNLILTVSLR
jgi:hypothetical protein